MGFRLIGIDDDDVAGFDIVEQVRGPSDHRNVEGAGDDGDVGGHRAFLEDQAAQPGPVIVEKLCRTHVAGDKDDIFGELPFGAEIVSLGSGQMLEQAIGEVLEVVQPLAQIGVPLIPEPGAGVVVDLFHRRFGCQAAVDRFADSGEPSRIFGEHAVGFQNVPVFAAVRHVGCLEHGVDGAVHFVDRFL